MKGYVVSCSIRTNVGAYIPTDLKVLPDSGGGIEVTTSEFSFNLNIDDAQDLVESLSLLLDDLLKEDNDV
jgi:hypothetical protein